MARYKVKGPDGAIHVIEGPENATPEQVTAFAQQHLSPKTQPATSETPSTEGMPTERSFGQAVMQAPQDVAMGVYKGFKNVTDTMVKGGASALDYLAGTNTRAAVDEAAARQNAEYQKEYGPRVLAKSGEILGEVGSTMLPIAGVSKIVAKGAELAPSLAKYLTPVAESIASGGFRTGLQSGGVNTGVRALGGATGGAIGAGLVNPEDAGAGAAFGAVVPALGLPAAKFVVEQGRKMIDPGAAAINQAVGNKGGQIISALRDPNAVIVPGSSPTAGQVAAPVGSTGFSGLTKDLSDMPKVSQLYADKTAQTNVARLEQQARVDARLQGVIDRVRDKVDTNLVNVTPSEIGNGLQAIGEKAKAEFKINKLNPGYAAAFDLAGNGKIDVSNVISKAEDILGQKLSTFAPETAPATIKKLFMFQPKTPEAKPLGGGLVSSKIKTAAEAPAGPPAATLKDLDDVRKAINADIRSAATGSGALDSVTLRNLGQLHQAIDDAIGKSTAIPDAAKTAYADVVNLYRTEYVPRFKEGANANLFKQTSLNELKTKPEDVITKYFNPGGESEAKQFVNLFGDNPDALKMAGKGIEDLYRQKVVDATTGLVKPEAHAKFLKDYAQPIRIMDDAGMGLGQRFATIGKDVQRLQRLEGMQAGASNKLAPGLPAGENALAVEQRINQLTQGLTPRQLSAVNAVRDDLARAAEYERLAQAGRTGKAGQIATEFGKEGGLPIPSYLSAPVTAFNFIVKRLMGKMDEKTAIALATELANPASAAKAIERSMVKRASQEINNQYARNALRPITMGGVNALAGQE